MFEHVKQLQSLQKVYEEWGGKHLQPRCIHLSNEVVDLWFKVAFPSQGFVHKGNKQNNENSLVVLLKYEMWSTLYTSLLNHFS